jgi:hypothetical protein
LEVVGRAYGRLSLKSIDIQERQKYSKLAVENLLLAHDADPQDLWIMFYLALHYAFVRDISKALEYIRAVLDVHGRHLESLHLLTLLLSSQKKF